MNFDRLMDELDKCSSNQLWFVMQYLENLKGVKVQTAKDILEEEE